MKRFLIATLALAAVYVSPAVLAQTPPNVPATLNVNWTLPTESACLQPAPATCVRVPLTGAYALTGVQLFVSLSPILDNSTLEPVASSGTVTNMAYNQVVPNGSTLYVRVKAVNASGASVFSTQATKLVMVDAPPGAPTGVTITLTIGT